MSGWGNSGGSGGGWGSSGGQNKPQGGGGGGWGSSGGGGGGGQSNSGGGGGGGGWGSSGGGGGGTGGWGSSGNNQNKPQGGGSGGWGTSGGGSSGGGWGQQNNNNQQNNNQQQQQQQQQQNDNPYTIFGNTAAGTSMCAQHLSRYDSSYNAVHANCHFRAFLHNMCPPGQSRPAHTREHLKWVHYGGGPTAEAWATAERDLPERDSYYVAPYHFSFALQDRQSLQQDQLRKFHTFLHGISNKSAELRETQHKNEERLKQLVQHESMLEKKLLQAMSRAEVLRRSGIRISSTEEHEILYGINAVRNFLGRLGGAGDDPSAATALTQQQHPANGNELREYAPAVGGDGSSNDFLLLAQQRPAVEYSSSETVEQRIRVIKQVFETQSTAGSGAIGEQDRLLQRLGDSVDTPTLRDWAKLLDMREDAIQRLQSVVQKDLRDILAIRSGK